MTTSGRVGGSEKHTQSAWGSCGVLVPGGSEHQGSSVVPPCPSPECATPLSQLGQRAKQSLGLLTSGSCPSPCAEVTAQLVPGKTHTLVVLIKQNFSLVEADRSAGLAINGIEFSSIVLGE